jgi:hypothetical protein
MIFVIHTTTGKNVEIDLVKQTREIKGNFVHHVATSHL